MRPQNKRYPMALTLIATVVACLASGPAFADNFFNALSLQGYTGILNTPSAHVDAEGSLQFLYSNQTEEMWRNLTKREENYLFSVGFFSFAEVGGRLTDTPGNAVRHLSAGVKISTAPLFAKKPLLPVFAVGIQDVGGGTRFLQTKYAVVSEDVWRIRLSAGYGAGPDRLKGAFGGVELKTCDWLY